MRGVPVSKGQAHEWNSTAQDDEHRPDCRCRECDPVAYFTRLAVYYGPDGGPVCRDGDAADACRMTAALFKERAAHQKTRGMRTGARIVEHVIAALDRVIASGAPPLAHGDFPLPTPAELAVAGLPVGAGPEREFEAPDECKCEKCGHDQHAPGKCQTWIDSHEPHSCICGHDAPTVRANETIQIEKVALIAAWRLDPIRQYQENGSPFVGDYEQAANEAWALVRAVANSAPSGPR